MTKYLAKAHLNGHEWQIVNQIRNHQFICDDAAHNAGPNPVEYLCGAVDSCITMSAGMIIKEHKMDIKNFRLQNEAQTRDLGHGESIVTAMKIKLFFESTLTKEQQEQFLKHVLRVSTVYKTLAQAIEIKVELA